MWFKNEKSGILIDRMINIFRRWKPKGQMYSLSVSNAGQVFCLALTWKHQSVVNVFRRPSH